MINGLTTKIYNTSKQLGVTPYMLLLSAYYILLSKYSSQEDIVVGSPIVGRNIAELYNLIGMFVNTLAMRANIDSNLSFKDFLSYIKDMCLNNYKYQDYPFDELVDKLKIQRDTSRNPLFDVMFIYQNNGNATADFGDIKTEYFTPDTKISKFDLSLEVIPENDILNLSFEYATALFNKQFIEDLSKHYSNILTSCLDNLNVKISNICMLSKAEKNKILYDFNNTKTDYPKDKTIAELFEAQAKKTPNNTAVVFGMQKLTYKELNEKANSLAYCLQNQGISQNDVIGIFLDKSLESVISIIAILKCNATYLPVDINYPNTRIDYMIKDSNCKLILSSLSLADKVKKYENVLFVDLPNDEIYSNHTSNPNTYASSDTTAYIMYTSGSTGNPKGVMVTNKNIVRLVKNTNYIKFEENERILQTGSIVFDACTFEIWGALLNGFELYIIKKQELLDSHLLEKYIVENKITILWLTAPLFNQLSENNPAMFKTARVLLTGGDVLSPKHINAVREACPNLTIINGYGPTENTTFSACFTINKTYTESIPIGYPIANSTCYVVSPTLNLLPVGVPGELLVGGDGVSKGYLNSPTYTAEKFIANPFGEGILYKTGDLVKWLPDGSIDFIGRIDNQVKIRGFRVELNEITLKIHDFPNIKECITVVKKINNEKVICSYFSSSSKIDVTILRDWLSKCLPHYAVPTYLINLETLPINANGKVDINRLPEPKFLNTKGTIIASRNNIDEQLINILKKLLNINEISIDDDFFKIGGDSLSSINLCAQIQNKFGCELYVNDILENPVIKDISDIIAKNINTSSKATIPKVEKRDFYPLSSAQKRMYLSTTLSGENSTLYNIPGIIIMDKMPDITKLEACLNALIARHEELRTSFEIVDNNIVQKIHDNLTLKLDISNDAISFDDLKSAFYDFVKPFDLSIAPLFRVKLIKLNDNRVALFVDMHHIISDGTSLHIFVRELCKLYNNQSLDKLNISYKDFAVWENNRLSSGDFKEAQDFWMNQFKNDIPVLNMPTNYLRPAVKSSAGNKVYFKFDKRFNY